MVTIFTVEKNGTAVQSALNITRAYEELKRFLTSQDVQELSSYVTIFRKLRDKGFYEFRSGTGDIFKIKKTSAVGRKKTVV